MKHIHRILLAIAAFTAVALVIPSATAHATPARVGGTPFVEAGFTADGTAIVAKLRDGVFAPNAAGSELQVLGRDGRVVDAMPREGTMDGFRVPLRWTVGADRSTATFTPIISPEYRAALDAAATDAAKKPRGKRISKAQRYDMMWTELNKGWTGNTPLYTLIGGLIGFLIWTIPGAAIGAAIGAYIGYQTSNPKAWPSVIAWWNTP
ncbi:hypothetical protein [Gordonia insulae]|uniref:DUF8020 domain-containing protein n=1 Tax=Gordonia insulae TaxID=2420509 RepID=A0A3G8JVS6_9ACTN|nr:hypothetical protein [Gordonia insulae]AZG48280.1 hypothetical protein D7316_04897 [Gordonia insulae]